MVVHDVKVPKRVRNLPALSDAAGQMLRELHAEMVKVSGISGCWVPIHPKWLEDHDFALLLTLLLEEP